jgi:hypothetical protein
MLTNLIMNCSNCRAFLLLSLVSTCVTMPMRATQVWTGPSTNFAMQAGADWTVPTNQDRITADVWLTRATSKGLFNAASETGYTMDLSPTNTEWSYGELTNYASLTYTNWENWNGKNPPSMVGQDAVVHLISDDIYLSLQFTSWGGFGGGFSYTRSTALPPPPPAVTLLNPSVAGTNFQFSFVSVAGRTHAIESRADLITDSWQSRTNLTGDGSTMTVQFPINPGGVEYFRLVTQ